MTRPPETLAEYSVALDGLFAELTIVRLFHAGVPVGYAKALHPAYGRDIEELHEFNVPVGYAAPFMAAQRRDMDCIIRCKRHDIPVEYAMALYETRRSWEIVELHNAGVPADYVLSFGPLYSADTITEGHRAGVAAEYLQEVLS